MFSIAPSTPSAGRKPIRVLIVDDSAIVRSLLTRELGRDTGIEVGCCFKMGK